jgi:hypothetical protein
VLGQGPLPDVLEGKIEPGRVFDRIVVLDGVPDGYRAMNDREAIKVMVSPNALTNSRSQNEKAKTWKGRVGSLGDRLGCMGMSSRPAE